ncbi:MAG: spore coat protein YlbD [Bacilli bacterium]|nr:spore coat protein YlbD [Bacilli bacterium]
MDKRSQFKEFVKKNPSLLKYVKNGEMTWQKFYEMYDLYDDDQTVWQDYLSKETVAAAATSAVGITEFFNWLKNINLDSVKEGVGSLQRVIGVVQDLSTKETTKPKEEYKPRPLYKHFDD